MTAMKMTLLEIVQKCLNSINADDVSSIDDTEEAQIVAGIVEDTYYSLVNTRWFPEHYETFQLVPQSDTNYPTTFRVPDNVGKIDWVRYNISTTANPAYSVMTYLEPEDFARRMYELNSSSSEISEFDNIVNGTPVFVWNNRMPRFYTSFDDNYILFDGYDSSVDTTLQGSKTVAWGKTIPVFQLVDTFTPDADPEFFPYLLAESQSVAHSVLLKTIDQKLEQRARRQKNFIQNDKQRVGNKNDRPNYGRC